MEYDLPDQLTRRLAELDAFINAEIGPLQHQDDNERFFDHRREWARTDFEAGGSGGFEQIYRHHRRYRITEGSEEVLTRKVAGYLFGFTGPAKAQRGGGR